MAIRQQDIGPAGQDLVQLGITGPVDIPGGPFPAETVTPFVPAAGGRNRSVDKPSTTPTDKPEEEASRLVDFLDKLYGQEVTWAGPGQSTIVPAGTTGGGTPSANPIVVVVIVGAIGFVAYQYFHKKGQSGD